MRLTRLRRRRASMVLPSAANASRAMQPQTSAGSGGSGAGVMLTTYGSRAEADFVSAALLTAGGQAVA